MIVVCSLSRYYIPFQIKLYNQWKIISKFIGHGRFFVFTVSEVPLGTAGFGKICFVMSLFMDNVHPREFGSGVFDSQVVAKEPEVFRFHS